MVDRYGDRIGVSRTSTPTTSRVRRSRRWSRPACSHQVQLRAIDQASQRNSDAKCPTRSNFVKDAPRIEIDQHLSEAEEQELWRHYGLNYDTGYADRAARRGRPRMSS